MMVVWLVLYKLTQVKQEAFKLRDSIAAHRISFDLCIPLWDKFDDTKINSLNIQWTDIKFLNDQETDISDDVKALPNDKGGLYIFIIKCPILLSTSEYLAYIGRAQLTQNHSLKVRCRKYLYEYCSDTGRPKITTMIGKWGKYLHLRYAVIEENDDTINIEASLINAILPPFNDEIPSKTIRDAVAAF